MSIAFGASNIPPLDGRPTRAQLNELVINSTDLHRRLLWVGSVELIEAAFERAKAEMQRLRSSMESGDVAPLLQGGPAGA